MRTGWQSAANTITIVAHSQGAAVALGALVQRPRPCTLITYGSGVRKLLRLEQSHRRSFWLFLIQWAWLYVLGLRWAFDVVAREVSGVLHGFRGAWPEAGMANLYLIAGPFMFYFIFAMLTLGDDPDPVAPALLRKYQALSGLVSWTDLAATADPVPAGLLLRDAPPDVDRKWLRWDSMSRLRSARVCNLASVFEDHTSYWRSLDDFLPRLYDALHSDAGAPDLNLELANPRYGNLWRRARSWLRVASSLTVLALVARLYVAIGEHSRLWVASLAGGWLERWTRYVQQFLPGVNSFGIWGISVALHLGAVALLWRFLTDPAWQAFDEAAALKRRWSCMGFFLLFLALWLAAAHLILAAIRARMYSAIPDDAWRLLYWLHGFMV